jgi:hypothetical protein
VPITASDIKLLASERMTDTADGGGRRTGNVIPDGVPGNIFPKVSRLDGVYGRVNLRKIFGAVQTPSLETYAGAHAVIIDAPDNDKIHANLFSTGSDFDDRTAARDRIESYVIAGPESRMIVYGRQLVGQQAVMAYQREEEPLPEVGEVFCLSKETAGVVEYQQYVRAEDVDHEVRTFADINGEFKRRVVTMTLSAPLRHEFPGQDAPLRFANEARPSLIRRTTVADASRYFGIQPVAEPALSGALTLKVASVYSPIVPTTQRESPVSNAQIGGAGQVLPAGTSPIPFRKVGPVVPGSPLPLPYTLDIGARVWPGSLRLYRAHEDGVTNTSPIGVDDGNGAIPDFEGPGGVLRNISINYETGILTLESQWNGGATNARHFVSYIPAIEVAQPAHTLDLPITLATRGTVVVQTLSPIPAPGSLAIDFRALGKWYRLRDDGNGTLSGDDPAYGVGTIDYVTGALVATIGALPDVGSNVLLGWASKVHYAIRAGATSDAGARVKQRIQLTELPAKPATLTVAYTSGGAPYTGIADANGAITGGNLLGNVNHATGELEIEYTTKMPDMETLVTVAYQQEVPSTSAPTSLVGEVTVTDPADILVPVDGSQIAPKGLRMLAPMQLSVGTIVQVDLADNGVGDVVTLDQSFTTSRGRAWITGGQVVGTVNYATGQVALNPDGVDYQYYAWSGSAWVIRAASAA